ncbi:hypothetical protein [Lentzea sp. E54]|uniref:hypothetical protein n=1 Tax=Lentzea xerophila TaxID=3435883 RepID=UPI003DA394F8
MLEHDELVAVATVLNEQPLRLHKFGTPASTRPNSAMVSSRSLTKTSASSRNPTATASTTTR